MFGSASGPDSPGAGKLFYDEVLRGRKFQVGPAKVTTLVWNRSAATAQNTPPMVEPLPSPPPVTTPVGGCSP